MRQQRPLHPLKLFVVQFEHGVLYGLYTAHGERNGSASSGENGNDEIDKEHFGNRRCWLHCVQGPCSGCYIFPFTDQVI